MRKNWRPYYQLTKDLPPSTGLVKAIELLGKTGEALDLGCGAGRDTRYLLAYGFKVTAVDRDAASLSMLIELPTEQLRLVQSSFEVFTFEHYDLVNAHYALPFLQKDQFSSVFAPLKASLNSGGVFVGQLFGIHDSWNIHESHLTFFSRTQALAQLEDLKVIEFEEQDSDGVTAEGQPKHWHVYHIIACKP